MIEKKEGVINELVYNYTTYNNGSFQQFIVIDMLQILITEINNAKNTTEYIKINPFYVNAKVNMQLEFDNYMFYMECRDNFTKEEQEEQISDCSDKAYNDMTEEERRKGHILYPLCKNGDYINFNQCLMSFQKYLDVLIPKLFQEAINKLQLKEEDIPFGYFCFEVHSG